MARRGQAVTISLFSFQDIITSVSGILIFITLMLVLELIQNVEGDPANRIARDLDNASIQAQRELDSLKDQIRRSADELLSDLGIPDKHGAAPGELSGGEQQRVALARALANRPDVVLADEPTGNLDSAAARDVLGLFREARGRGQTLLLVTHDASVASAADRVITLRDGLVAHETELAAARQVTPLLELPNPA